MAKDVWTRATPWFGPDKKTEKVWPTWLCRNPKCKSYGLSHPGCKCGIPSISSQYKNLEYDFSGGEVGRHCDTHQAHDESCPYFADGGTVQANQEFEANPTLALDHSIASHGLLHALTTTGHSRSENLNKPSEDFMEHHHRGRKSIKAHTQNHFDPKHEHPEKGETHSLRGYLDSVRENPMQLLDMPGLPGLNAHSAALGAKAATAVQYFDGLRPQQAAPGPLDPVMPPNKMAEQAYERQLGIAERPLSILAKVRDGTILPADMQTLNTLYPELAKSIQSKAFESLVEAKTKGTQIPYKHRMGLSFLLGQPLDATMTQSAMAAIMKANAGAQTETQGMPGKQGKVATAATQKTIERVDKMYQTPLQKIQTGK